MIIDNEFVNATIDYTIGKINNKNANKKHKLNCGSEYSVGKIKINYSIYIKIKIYRFCDEEMVGLYFQYPSYLPSYYQDILHDYIIKINTELNFIQLQMNKKLSDRNRYYINLSSEQFDTILKILKKYDVFDIKFNTLDEIKQSIMIDRL